MSTTAPRPLGVGFSEQKSDTFEFTENYNVTVNDKPPAWVSPEDAPAYRLANLLSLPRLGKWRGQAYAGMVVPRATLKLSGDELKRLLKLEAIFPATRHELSTYEREYGEAPALLADRERQFTELRRSLRKRTRAARKESAKAKLLNDLILEWSDIENQCRMRWSGEFGVLMGKSEEQVLRYYVDRESDLRTLGGKEDIYREHIAEIAEPLLIAAAGFSMDIAPLHDFVKSTSFQWNLRNPKEWEVLAWLPSLSYRLLHQEKQKKSRARRLLSALAEHWWKIVAAVVTAIIISFLAGYLRPWGILK